MLRKASQEDQIRLIQDGKYTMEGEIWGQVSENSKDLIRKMLCKDPGKRITSKEAMEHPCIVKFKEGFFKNKFLGKSNS